MLAPSMAISSRRMTRINSTRFRPRLAAMCLQMYGSWNPQDVGISMRTISAVNWLDGMYADGGGRKASITYDLMMLRSTMATRR